MRQGIGDDQARRRVNNIEVKQQVSQRGGDKHHPGQRELVVEHGAEIAQALLKSQPAAKQRIIDAENLRHPARPAGTLDDVHHQAFSSEACGQWDIEKGRLPPQTLKLQRRMSIFGHRFDGETADLRQRLATDHRAGAAEKGGVPVVVPLLNRAIEQHPFVGNVASDGEVTFKWIRGIEVVRRLHQSQHRVFQEAADGGLQEHARGDVVAVENADKLPLSQGQRMVKVPRFGVLVVIAGDIAHPNVGGEDGKLAALTVIQKIDFHFIFWIINALCRQDGIAHHLQRFVIARNIDIDRRPLTHIIRQRNNAALQRPDRLQIVKQ